VNIIFGDAPMRSVDGIKEVLGIPDGIINVGVKKYIGVV
jgi:hypothetical protein